MSPSHQIRITPLLHITRPGWPCRIYRLVAVIVAVLWATACVAEIGDAHDQGEATSLHAEGTNVRAQLASRIEEVHDEEKRVRRLGLDDGKSDCSALRTGFGKASMIDLIQCFAGDKRKQVTERQDCSQLPTKTNARAYLWLRKCGFSRTMKRFYRDIDCGELSLGYMKNYANFKNHFRAAKCEIGPRSCEVDGAVIPHNQMFLGYRSDTATIYMDTSYYQSSTCASNSSEYVCKNGEVQTLLGNPATVYYLSCHYECKMHDEGTNFHSVPCQGPQLQQVFEDDSDHHLEAIQGGVAHWGTSYTLSTQGIIEPSMDPEYWPEPNDEGVWVDMQRYKGTVFDDSTGGWGLILRETPDEDGQRLSPGQIEMDNGDIVEQYLGS